MFAYVTRIGKFTSWPLALAIIVGTFGPTSLAQTPQRPTQPSIDEIVSHSARQVRHYSKEFKDLLAKETKTIRIFDDNETLKKERVIVSNFLVYQVSRGSGEITEFRSVLSVDAKPVSDVEKRAVELFERVSNAETTARELERIHTEGWRYDDGLHIMGLTLFQGVALAELVRESFLFEVVGREMLGNSDVYIIRYNQIKETDLIREADKTSRPAVMIFDFDLDGIKSANPRLSGTFWIDAHNYQILREQRRLSLHPEGFDKPVVLASNEFEYSVSDFGINIPKRIQYTQYRLDRKTRKPAKQIEFIFSYSDFSRPKVDVTSDKPM